MLNIRLRVYQGAVLRWRLSLAFLIIHCVRLYSPRFWTHSTLPGAENYSVTIVTPVTIVTLVTPVTPVTPVATVATPRIMAEAQFYRDRASAARSPGGGFCF